MIQAKKQIWDILTGKNYWYEFGWDLFPLRWRRIMRFTINKTSKQAFLSPWLGLTSVLPMPTGKLISRESNLANTL